MPAPERLILLDVDRITQAMRRHEMSERTLSKALRLSPQAAGRLLRGDNHSNVTLAILDRLSRALGIPHEELWLAKEPGEQHAGTESRATDARILGALLLDADRGVKANEFSDALQWPLGRVSRAAGRLAQDARTIGAEFSRTYYGYRLRADEAVAPPSAIRALREAPRRRRDLSAYEANILVAIRQGAFTHSLERPRNRGRYLANGAREVAVRRLMALGYIEPTSTDRFRLTSAASFGLGATNRAPLRRAATSDT